MLTNNGYILMNLHNLYKKNLHWVYGKILSTFKERGSANPFLLNTSLSMVMIGGDAIITLMYTSSDADGQADRQTDIAWSNGR